MAESQTDEEIDDNTITVELLSTTTTSTDDRLADLVRLVNDVYDVAEAGMWNQTGVRTTVDELTRLAQRGHLLVARRTRKEDDDNDDSGRCGPWVGCVKVDSAVEEKALDYDEGDGPPQAAPVVVGELSMLVVDPQHRRRGIGGRLIAAAEDWARHSQRGCTQMQLELLTPRHWTQPSKAFNQRWYTRLGYVPRRTRPFETDYPQLANLLATECDYTIWRKSLVSENKK